MDAVRHSDIIMYYSNLYRLPHGQTLSIHFWPLFLSCSISKKSNEKFMQSFHFQVEHEALITFWHCSYTQSMQPLNRIERTSASMLMLNYNFLTMTLTFMVAPANPYVCCSLACECITLHNTYAAAAASNIDEISDWRAMEGLRCNVY